MNLIEIGLLQIQAVPFNDISCNVKPHFESILQFDMSAVICIRTLKDKNTLSQILVVTSQM